MSLSQLFSRRRPQRQDMPDSRTLTSASDSPVALRRLHEMLRADAMATAEEHDAASGFTQGV